MAVAFEKSGNDVQVVLLRHLAKDFRGWPGDRFRTILIALSRAEIGHRFAEYDQISFILRRRGDQLAILLAVTRWGFAARSEVNGSEANFSRGWSRHFSERNVTPFDLAAGCPEQMQFDNCSRRFCGSAISIRDFGPACGIRCLVGRVFRFSSSGVPNQISSDGRFTQRHGFAFVILPEDAYDCAPPRRRDIHDLSYGVEMVMLTAGNRE